MSSTVLCHLLGDALLAVLCVAQPVVDHRPHSQGSGVATQEGHLAAVEVPQAPLHIV